MNIDDGGNCFGCGKNNPCGLKLSFNHVDGKTTSEFTPSALHHGYENITHGGIISAVLDEAMVYAALNVLDKDTVPVTAEISVRFRKPLPAGQKSYIEAEIVSKGTRLIETKARLMSSAGAVIAEGRGKLLIK